MARKPKWTAPADDTEYRWEGGGIITYGQMTAGLEEFQPKSDSDVEWLLFCFGAEPVSDHRSRA